MKETVVLFIDEFDNCNEYLNQEEIHFFSVEAAKNFIRKQCNEFAETYNTITEWEGDRECEVSVSQNGKLLGTTRFTIKE